MRLAIECGRPDWEQFADELTPEQLDEWRAFDLVDGLPHQRIAHAISMGFAAVMSGFGGDRVSPELFLPRLPPKRENVRSRYDAKASVEIEKIRANVARFNRGK